MVLCTMDISGRGEYTDLGVRLPDSGEEGLLVSLLLALLLASYSDDVVVEVSIWEDVVVLEASELLLVTSLSLWEGVWSSSRMSV